MGSVDKYRSISSPSSGIYRDRGSKFIGLAFPISSEQDVKQTLENVKKEYHDARHHCYAYQLGLEGDIHRANDDGEPSGSAGLPILNQIRSSGISDILIIVVRYFGGTKLGVPGLIHAYKAASALALEAAETCEVQLKRMFLLDYAYHDTQTVLRLIDQYNGEVESQGFDEECHQVISIRESKAEEFIQSLNGSRIESLRWNEVERS